MEKKITEFKTTESIKNEKFFKKKQIEKEIQLNRYKRFEEYLKTHDFDELLYRLILENGEDWKTKCWENGCEAYPNNKLGFILKYIHDNYEPIKVSKIDIEEFDNEIYFFKGYYFQTIYGQGSFHRIYNAKDYNILLSL